MGYVNHLFSNVSLWTLERNVFQAVVKSAGQAKDEERFNLLSKVETLKQFPEAKLRKIADCLEEETFEPNTLIFKQGFFMKFRLTTTSISRRKWWLFLHYSKWRSRHHQKQLQWRRRECCRSHRRQVLWRKGIVEGKTLESDESYSSNLFRKTKEMQMHGARRKSNVILLTVKVRII